MGLKKNETIMAAIDKIQCSSYEEFLELRIWVMTFNPAMAVDFYNFFLSYEDYYSNMEATRAALQNENSYMTDIKISIANFSSSHNKYLKWHCPIPFVREYLEKQCGYKTRWYHRLFFKYLPYRHSDTDTFWQKMYKKIQMVADFN